MVTVYDVRNLDVFLSYYFGELSSSLPERTGRIMMSDKIRVTSYRRKSKYIETDFTFLMVLIVFYVACFSVPAQGILQ